MIGGLLYEYFVGALLDWWYEVDTYVYFILCLGAVTGIIGYTSRTTGVTLSINTAFFSTIIIGYALGKITTFVMNQRKSPDVGRWTLGMYIVYALYFNTGRELAMVYGICFFSIAIGLLAGHCVTLF